MQDLKTVYLKMQAKRKEKNQLGRMISDALANNADYKKISEDLKVMREKKKSIENQVKAECLADVQQLDTLRLEIAAAGEILSDIALTMYTNRETVEIVDEDRGLKLTPVFSVKFQKEDLDTARTKSKAEASAEARAASHPERTFLPQT
jgi:hypothetical protein